MLNWLAFQLVMHGPFCTVDADTAIGRWCLPRAGAWAYREHFSHNCAEPSDSG